MTPDDVVRQREAEHFAATFATMADELMQLAQDAGRPDVALVAGDAAVAAFALLDVLVRAPLRLAAD